MEIEQVSGRIRPDIQEVLPGLFIGGCEIAYCSSEKLNGA